MRILNNHEDKSIKDILILLTPNEANELKGKILKLTDEKGDHFHINDHTYEREITIAIYTPDNLDSFNPRVKDLIIKDI